MKRRKALQQIGMGMSGGLLLPSVFAACTPSDPGPEISYSGSVAILGAGAAGLYAADILRSKGIKVKVFEARNQIGGRIRSLRNQPVESYPFAPQLGSDFPIELGAQTIMGTDSILGKIFQDYRVKTVEFPASGNRFVLDKIVNGVLKDVAQSAADWGSDVDFVAAMDFRENLKSQAGSTQTTQGAIQAAGIGTRAFGMLEGQIGNAYGGNNATMGVGELGEEETKRTGDGKVIGLASNPLQDIIISRFSLVQQFVQLNTPIKSIDYSADPIVLTSADGSKYEANKVIVTVPVSILKNGSLSFSPGLPGSFSTSLSKIGMGASMRAVIEFKKNFWGESSGFIFGSANVPEYFSAGVGRSAFNTTLSITVNGSKAASYSSLGDGAIDAILADLDSLYHDEATPPLGFGTKFVRKDINTLANIFVREDWTTMEHILGGYSYPLAGAKMDDRKEIGQAVGGKLFFAGEATDVSGQAGMVNGALASAERVAQEVVTSILNP